MARAERGDSEQSRKRGLVGRRAFRKLLLVSTAAALLFGCLSPTLPLPPPSDPIVSVPDETGEITITGRVQSRAKVFVQNDRSDEIVGEVTGDSGRYELQMQAEIGDILFVWETSSGRESPSTTVVVPSENSLTITDVVEGAAGASSE